jgi:lysozyme family protein
MSDISVFSSALKITLAFEGGFVNDPADPGGDTNYGITQKVYDKYRFERNLPYRSVKYVFDEEYAAIYQNQYWVPGSCALLHPPVGAFHFDTCVHVGLNQAGKLLQRALGMPETAVDGIIGEHTIDIAEIIPSQTTIDNYAVLRLCFYDKIIHKNPALETFRNGWVARVKKLEVEVFKI